MEQKIEKVRDIKEAWARLKHLKSFWALVGLFLLIPVVRVAEYFLC
jgi:hypothetical protein